jgi:hypothetical protein
VVQLSKPLWVHGDWVRTGCVGSFASPSRPAAASTVWDGWACHAFVCPVEAVLAVMTMAGVE